MFLYSHAESVLEVHLRSACITVEWFGSGRDFNVGIDGVSLLGCCLLWPLRIAQQTKNSFEFLKYMGPACLILCAQMFQKLIVLTIIKHHFGCKSSSMDDG